MVIIKMRGGNRMQEVREYEITSNGIVIQSERLKDYQRLITGIPERIRRSALDEYPPPGAGAKNKN